MSAKEKTMFTAVDSFASKLSATTIGYYDDEFLQDLQVVTKERVGKKQPIIHLGYYTRVSCFRRIVHEFLEKTKAKSRQIINIGCGYDTLAFHLLKEGHQGLTVFEVDYQDVILKKTDLIHRSEKLSQLLQWNGNKLGENYGFQNGSVKFVSTDLQNSNLVESLSKARLSSSSPTLILSECVLVYMDTDSVSSLCTSLVSYLSNADVAWVSYDMYNPSDTFGKMMRRNLETTAGFKIPGFTDFPTLDSHIAKFVNGGMSDTCTKACSMLDIFNKTISNDEKKRLQKLERLDEIEEWEMLMSHYCLLLGVRGEALLDLAELIP